MLKLEIRRFAKERTRTLGNLYVDGEFWCNTLEDTDRTFPYKCNNTYFTYRGLSSVCTHIINRGDSCAVQGKYEVKLKYIKELNKSLLIVLGEPHHQYIYLTGLKSIDKLEICTQIKIGFYDEETKKFNLDSYTFRRLRMKILRYLSRKEKVELKINYNDA